MYWNITDRDRLFTAFDLADNKDLVAKLFLELSSENELQQLETRLNLACLLFEGVSYKNIIRLTGFSSATIAKMAAVIKPKESALRHIIQRMLDLSPDDKSYDED